MPWADTAYQADVEGEHAEAVDVLLYKDGTEQAIEHTDSQPKQQCHDNYTNTRLPRHVVIAAIIDEVS